MLNKPKVWRYILLLCAIWIGLSISSYAAGVYKTTARVNLRASASLDAPVLRLLEGNTAVEAETYDPSGWSKVTVYGLTGYIKSEYLQPVADASYATLKRVNLRVSASLDAAVLKTLDAGLALDMISFDPEGWSKVRVDGKEGYIKSEYIKETPLAVPAMAVVSEPAETSAATVTSTPEETPAALDSMSLTPVASVASENASTALAAQPEVYRVTTRVNLRSEPSLDAAILSKVNAGTKVDMLSYDAANWSRVSVGGTTGYIKSEYLVSADAYAGGIAENGVELVEWEQAKKIVTLNKPITIYDVRSGAVYTVQSFSNGQHADVEPLTKADTETMKKSFGGAWAWDGRPVWVTINGRTMAAAINGMPHGGGIISDNGMNGQVCLHFLGSRVHNGNTRYQQTLQNAVQEAWNARNS